MIKRSFFKLPIIFSLTYYIFSVLVSMGWLVSALLKRGDDYFWEIFPMYASNMFIQHLKSLFLYFVVVAILCYRYRIHKVSGRNIGMIFIAVLLAMVCQTALGYLWSMSAMSLLQYYALDMSWMIVAQMIFGFVILIVMTLIVIFLFRLLAPMAEREEPFEFDGNNFGWVHGVLFTASLMTVFIILGLYALSSFIQYSYYYSDVYNIVFFLGIILGLMIHIFFIYFSVRRCFTQVYDTLQVARIFKSAGITLVILIGVSIVFGLIMSVFGMMYLNSRDWGALIIFGFVCILLALVVNYVSLFLSSRFAVRQYFS
ncbi:LTA synthase family protein [Zophobihabitans entericus]|uniref:Uncharacterized protein n=1 Tax=Zophobihabitans entericus TaxID=1635327 RepID=A0A6G9IAP5_9GAMM|nr:hypothetical protein [Zophobihabitans entericus]QIQ20907.1 hypothetical protein IPMB12_03940 [Zophobihabitans entericus]